MFAELVCALNRRERMPTALPLSLVPRCGSAPHVD